ncbi:hypothetical protein ALI44B_04565 [Leifsonia sp. ALI-44-B]|uniref:hypothetical protein n=1 Tax=Leifsonia sp. ALI-44-B TaxID=1933776 RepID=UPI00097C3663|nr:hypothetical protein [Leifsonia sp. ALI-44-B]ONI63903.1 hypothetical protein ALI44B_04565 [Leifsonia sp. ALI-44-B]
MPATLTATASPDGSVLLIVGGAATDDKLMRSDRNGTAPVRLFPNQGIIDGGLLVTDNEASLMGQVVYSIGTASQTITFDGQVLTDILLTPVLPQNRNFPLLTLEHSYGRPSTSTKHQVINRPDKLAALGPLGYRSGSLSFLVASASMATELEAIYDKGEVVLLRFSTGTNPLTGEQYPAERDLYHLSDDVRVNRDRESASGFYKVDVNYTEIRRPSSPLAGSFGWTYNDVRDQFASYDEVAMIFPTYNDLAVGGDQ